jgi:hypothetical protein
MLQGLPLDEGDTLVEQTLAELAGLMALPFWIGAALAVALPLRTLMRTRQSKP